MEVLIVLVVLWLIFAGLGYYVAGQKGRPESEGLILGFLFGPLGCLIVALLPAVQAEPKRFEPRPARPSPWDRYAEEEEEEEDPAERQAYEFLTDITPERAPSKDTIDLDAIARAAKIPLTGRTDLENMSGLSDEDKARIGRAIAAGTATGFRQLPPKGKRKRGAG